MKATNCEDQKPGVYNLSIQMTKTEPSEDTAKTATHPNPLPWVQGARELRFQNIPSDISYLTLPQKALSKTYLQGCHPLIIYGVPLGTENMEKLLLQAKFLLKRERNKCSVQEQKMKAQVKSEASRYLFIPTLNEPSQNPSVSSLPAPNNSRWVQNCFACCCLKIHLGLGVWLKC